MTGPLRGGGGVQGRAIKEKITFLEPFFQRTKISTAIKLEGGGEGGEARPLKEELFLRFP